MSIQAATTEQLQEFLDQHPAWESSNGKLHREYRFNSFTEAFAFMTRVALVAEKNDHHPEWCNIYNRVIVDLVTHEAQAITQRDFVLAQAMDAFC